MALALVLAAGVLVAALTASAALGATWCGTPATADRPLQVSAGYSVHFVYAIPSDGADALATWGPVMQADAETADAWWHREDPTRTLRLDTFPFTCGPQLDITFLRLPQTGAELDPIANRADLIFDGLQSPTRILSPFQKTVVYYDGPDTQSGEFVVCGQGGGQIAFAYVNACEGVPNDATVVHEILHSLGAVANGAPHLCGGDLGAHTCDIATDLMYPYASTASLTATLLDPGRDDYYGHSGSWTDTQDSEFLVRLDQQTPLTLAVQGNGRVTSGIPGVDCSTSCASQWNSGTTVTLSPTPAEGQRFVGWSGGCSGVSECSVVLTQAATVSALFAPSTYALSVRLTGKGTVRGGVGRVACPSRCRVPLASYTTTRLTATPAKGWRFKSWSGACRGTRATCSVPMTRATSVRATFARKKA